MIYEISPGCLIETDQVLHEEELSDARKEFEAGKPLAEVAVDLGGTVHTPLARERRADHVTIPREDYIALLRKAGELE